jgi:hypothetical protein
MTTPIPTYLPNGRRIKDRTLMKIEELRSAGKVVVKLNYRGRVVRATYREEFGAHPVRKAPHRGTRYSSQEHLPGGRMAWKHRDYPRHLDLTPFFQATPLSLVRQGKQRAT